MKFKPYGFAASSENMLRNVHPAMQLIMAEVKKYCMIDFDISCGHRTIGEQRDLFLKGKSKKNGITELSKHQSFPSEAVDIYTYKYEGNGKASYTVHQMCFIAGIVQAVALQLYSQGKIPYIIRWGGNWDSDGWIIDDQDFQDLCHFELVEV